MAWVTGLLLSHFRSHALTRLAFDGRPVAIWGANGSGKTNLLEALSLLSPGRGLRRAGPEELARQPERLGWKVVAGVQGDLPHEVETWAEAGGTRQVRIDGKAAPQVALARLMTVLWLTPAMDRLWSEGAEGRRRFFDRVAMSFEPDHAEASLAYDKAMRERNRLLRDGIQDPYWYDALEAQMAETGARITANRITALTRIAAAQAGAETRFPAADLMLTQPEGAPEADAVALARQFAEGRRRDMAAGRTLTGPHRADIEAVWREKGMAAALCSTGEQKALLLSLILANARALAEDTGHPPLLLLDEAAAHLDPERRAALAEEIVALAAQAFLTGTDPVLFESLAGRASFYAVEEAEGRSSVQHRSMP
ncbi:DNA replication/repair protein RecF [Haematobacter genomosp. 1]|uniref:DNA replication and repair protein RecF n=1 Tax=Haematobacter genomosp. 1 TaxID=366618 RepID=A0A212A7U2_9RHOB|nr:DNA replication/repair protein RecF [Haematobacter genomosp. 1]OWJ75483.1 DNA replication/repair protein RecF [Haematobacter genomosp. 1]